MQGNEVDRQAAFFDVPRNQFATEEVLRPARHTRREIDEVLKRLVAHQLPPAGRVLDFGAGTGRLTIPLLQRGFAVTAVDVSENSLESLRNVAARSGLDGLETRQHLPEDDRYDAIVGADILHHVDMGEYLPKLRRLLADGAPLAFSEPGALNPTWYVYLPLAYDWAVEKGVTTCTPWNLERELRQAGFQDVRITGLGVLPRSLTAWSDRLCTLNDRLGDVPLARLVAYRYIVEAKA